MFNSVLAGGSEGGVGGQSVGGVGARSPVETVDWRPSWWRTLAKLGVAEMISTCSTNGSDL